MHSIRSALLCALLASLVFAVGCAQKLVPVEGTVTVMGKGPLDMGEVMFYPEGGGKTARGKIESGGKYRLETDGKPGAPPGKYKVTVNPDAGEVPDSTKAAVPVSSIDPSFLSSTSTRLSVEVKAGADPSSYNLTVDPAK
jgi:hypothetical protein